MLDWLIIGGGVHGTHLSHALRARADATDRLAVLDPEPRPLARFLAQLDATGLTHLRSPSVHHLDLDPYGLLRFAATPAGRPLASFVEPYHRPSLALFRAHCDHVITAARLDELRQAARASAVERIADGYRIETDRGALTARRVVLALGQPPLAPPPAWAAATPIAAHVFAADFDRRAVRPGARVAVIGGGVTAAQLALALAAAGAHPVIIARHPIRRSEFDSDAAWLGPKAMRGFLACADRDRRRQLIARARRRGSMPRETAARIRRAIRARALAWHLGEVRAAAVAGGHVALTLGDGALVTVDHVVLATGFAPARPGGALVDRLAADLGLRCAACGFPIVGADLAWAPGLYVSGALAELELGPTGRNIAGAREAARRIAGPR